MDTQTRKTATYRMLPEFAQLGNNFFEPVDVTFDIGCEPTPYHSIMFAIKYDGDETPTSLFKSDTNKAWNNTNAALLLSDDGLPVHIVTRMTERNGIFGEAVCYNFALYNPQHPMFKPTIHKAIDFASNLETEVIIEVMLAFDDMVFPLYLTEKTSGTFAMSLADFYKSILDEIENDPKEVLLEQARLNRCIRHYEFEKDGFDGVSFHCTSRFGEEGDVDIEDSDLDDLHRHISGIRIIDHKTTIHNRSLDNIKPEPKDDIRDGEFVSVWDGGYEIHTPCKVNMDTNEIFDIKVTEANADGVETLDYERVIVDGKTYEAMSRSDADEYDDYHGFVYDN